MLPTVDHFHICSLLSWGDCVQVEEVTGIQDCLPLNLHGNLVAMALCLRLAFKGWTLAELGYKFERLQHFLWTTLAFGNFKRS